MTEKRPVTFRLWEVLLVVALAFVLTCLSLCVQGWHVARALLRGRTGIPSQVIQAALFPCPGMGVRPLFPVLLLGSFIWWLLICIAGAALLKRRAGWLGWGLFAGIASAGLVMFGFYNAALAGPELLPIGWPLIMCDRTSSVFGPGRLWSVGRTAANFLFWLVVLCCAACAVTFMVARPRPRRPRSAKPQDGWRCPSRTSHR